MNQKILVAKIASAHGIKGEIKIISFCKNPKDIKNYKNICDKDGNNIKLEIGSKPQGKNNDIFIVNINNIKDRNEAENIVGTEFFVDREDLAIIEEKDEFYFVDLIGLEVINETDIKIGIVTNVMNYGAGDIVEVEFEKKLKDFSKTELLPFNNDIFPEVSLEKGFIRIILPDLYEIK